VMAHESFEDPATAALMNEHLVAIKVDREERPDVDAVYMTATQAMTGQGGWPMTVFLTPAGEPFYGGTYFPPEDRHGMPGFRRLLLSVADAWRLKPDDIERAAASVREVYAASRPKTGDRGPKTEDRGQISPDTLDRAARDLFARFEPMMGGFGGAPKFPGTMALDFLLRRWARTGDAQALHIVRHSFAKMARGGIYDQVGGGFHRYAVDARWIVPHFEKMLYDNALLAQLGVHLWQATGDAEVRRVAGETLDWVLAEMTDAAGGWYSSLDADSEHEEGKFYVWSIAELTRVLGADAPAAIAHWGATAAGNFEGANILTVRDANDGVDPSAVSRWRAALYAVRAKRVWPARDEKILASWNGLMLRAMAEGARVLGNARHRDAALRNGDFLWREMVRDGRVYRTHTRGETRIAGFLEDQAAVGLGFVALYQLTFDRTWFDRARVLCDVCVARFRDAESGMFFDTASDAEVLVTRPRDIMDNATPAGSSLAAELLLAIAEVTGDSALRAEAAAIADAEAEPMARYATMFGHLLGVADTLVSGAIEVAIAGEPGEEDFRALTAAVAARYVPGLVMAGGSGEAVRGMELMEARAMIDRRATAYVCKGYACELPVVGPEALGDQLAVIGR
ncbi:MAG: thioredoxin domain-containing protein, partial [Gemmatimonadaceae bacterium]